MDRPPTKRDVCEVVIGVIAEVLGMDRGSIPETGHLVTDFSANSLDQVELVMQIEEKFKTDLTELEKNEMLRVNEIVEIIWNRIQMGIATFPSE